MSDKKFADDQIEELLGRLEQGESLTVICTDARLPSRASVYSWIETDAEFAGRFRAARARGVHALAEQCLTIADEKPIDAVHVADKRVRIDTRLRLAGKWLASEYGERLSVNHSGQVTHQHDLSSYSADELDALEKLISKGSNASGDKGGEGAQKAASLH